MRLRRLIGFFCGSVILSLTACNAPAPREGGPSSRELRIPIDRDIQTLDPVESPSIDIVTHNVLRQLYEGLVDYDPRTLAVVPRVAKAWEVSPDGLVWSFELNQGVMFADDRCFPGGRGREVTAEDVKYSLQRGLAHHIGSSAGATLPEIVGQADFLAGRTEELSGIEVRSRYQLRIRLARPDPRLLHHLAVPHCYVVPREADDAYTADRELHAVGTGPYRLVSWSPSGLLLVRRDDYWRRNATATVETLRFVLTLDSHRLYALNQTDLFFSYDPLPDSGMLEPMVGSISRTPDPLQKDTVREPEEQRYLVPWLNTIFIRFNFNSAHPAVQQGQLRRALSLAVQRSVRAIHQPARGLLPPSLRGHDPNLVGQVTDPELARRLLPEHAASLPVLRILFPHADGLTGQYCVADLQRLGLNAELVLREREEFDELVRGGEVELFRAGWVADYPDPQNFLQLFYSASPLNTAAYASPRFDQFFERLASEPRPERRRELGAKAERQLIEDTAAVFLRHERQMQIVSPRVTNWRDNCTNPLNIHFYERVGLRANSR